MIQVTDTIAIDENDLQFQFVRSSGPGGQNVNKVATAVQLRINLYTARGITDDLREMLMKREKKRINNEGELIIDARRFRSQEKNREDAVERLKAIIEKASYKPPKRKPSRPSKAAKEKRLSAKKQQSQRKQDRQKNWSTD